MTMEIVTVLTFLVMGLGLAGALLPALPGLPLIFLAALGHKLLFPEVTSWWLVAWLALIAAAGIGVDLLAGWAGAKLFGASKWGMVGALIGLFLGIPFSLPGLVLGPILGAIVAELVVARRSIKEASKSGVGAGVGFIASKAMHLIMGVIMIGSFGLALILK